MAIQEDQQAEQEAAIVDLSVFQPTEPAAMKRINFMMQRGAVVVGVKKKLVTFMHSGRSAQIDANGQVSWA